MSTPSEVHYRKISILISMYYVTTFARQRLQSNLASSYGKSWGKLVIIVFQAHHVIQLSGKPKNQPTRPR